MWIFPLVLSLCQKQELLLLLLPHQHPRSPVRFGPHPNLLFLTAHLHLPTTPHLRPFPLGHPLHLLHPLTAMEKSWRWRWRWTMITMGSLQPLELRKTAVGDLLYLQLLLRWRYWHNKVSFWHFPFLKTRRGWIQTHGHCNWWPTGAPYYFQTYNEFLVIHRVQSHRWGKVKNVKPVRWIKPLLLAAVPFSTPSLLPVQVSR